MNFVSIHFVNRISSNTDTEQTTQADFCGMNLCLLWQSMASSHNLKMINNYWESKVLKENPEFEFEPFATHLQIARFPELVFFSIINGQSLQNNNSVIILFLYFDLNLGKFHVPSWSKVELLMVYTSQFVMWFHQHIPYFITLTLNLGRRRESETKCERLHKFVNSQKLNKFLIIGCDLEQQRKKTTKYCW